jgi:S-methylmethionine-dependent homocysteine/selenocysteine methylase
MNKITLLDGGMGQELLRRSARPVTRLWSADVMMNEPHLVRDLHRDFIVSGARVITLNSYTATPERLARENVYEQLESLHACAMQAATQAIDLAQTEGVKIAGCLPPLVASYQPEVILPFEVALNSYRRLVELQDSASDIFLCETMASIAEARAACTAGIESGKPVWLALTVSDTHFGQLRSGEPLREAIKELASIGASAILLNCSQPEAISACWKDLTEAKHFSNSRNQNEQTIQIGAYANGFVSIASLHPGVTVEVLETRQDLNPEQYANIALGWANDGAAIIGGCCEIGPEHIAALRDKLLEQDYCV